MLTKSDTRTLEKLLRKSSEMDLANLFLRLGDGYFGSPHTGPAHDCPACWSRHEAYLELRRQFIECVPKEWVFAEPDAPPVVH
ncbi:hypothetical protein [Kozakia baliensis]|uniref:hypothetical protein n=1 Tax=Kozakia baliensis TaxID=153496 RepID=UPI0004965DEA|nr:hypothetical protein [Kozakia baliensis]